MRSLRVLLLAVVSGVVALAGCGSDEPAKETRIVGTTLTVYSSLPLTGPLAPVARDIVRAEKLALREAGGRAGLYTVNFVALDNANPKTGRWDPGLVAANARKAVQDRSTIAYLGEIENGASAVSLPILNAGGILQVSPRDTFSGLTERGGRGEPDKYYPSGRRTFTRVVPPDDGQAAELVDVMRSQGVKRLLIADDRQLTGTRLGDQVEGLAKEAGIEVVDRRRLNANGKVPDDIGRKAAEERVDAFFYGGAYRDFAAQLLQEVHRDAPGVKLFGADDLAIAPELPEAAGAAAPDLTLTGVDPDPTRADSRAFRHKFTETYGTDPDRQAVLGYRAMRLVLAAISRLGPDASSRRAVVAETLRIAKVPRAEFVRYRVVGGRLVRVGPPL